MLVKVFLKRKPGGEFVRNDLEWQTHYYEAPRISAKHTDDFFSFYFDNEFPSGIDGVNFSNRQFGYEIYSSQGNLIERFVTAVLDKVEENDDLMKIRKS